MIPLFEYYPALKESVAHTALAQLPTPVAPLVINGVDAKTLHVKRDDLSGEPYGGNKVRKLEFLLGQAVKDGVKTVMTFGAAGSNHALATAIYSRPLGLRCISMLVPQVNAHSVQRNLLRGHLAGADLHHYLGRKHVALGALYHFNREMLRHGQFPRVIPPGGSSPVGCLGFLNAALELRAQVDAGALPTPDVIYVASGTMGTCVGLLMGLQLAGLNTRVMAIRVTDPPYTSPERARGLYAATNSLLRAMDGSIPDLRFPEEQFTLRDEFLGEKYSLYTAEGMAAVARAREAEQPGVSTPRTGGGLKLEGTYTGKAFAALLSDSEAGALRSKHVVFWNTYNSRDFSKEIEGIDYHLLPQDFRRYFEEPVQPRDA